MIIIYIYGNHDDDNVNNDNDENDDIIDYNDNWNDNAHEKYNTKLHNF